MSAKGMKINTGKTKVMVSAVGAGEETKSGVFPCGVCGKGVGSNSIKCTKCGKWVHGRCSGIAGSLTGFEEGFTCKKCRGVLPRPSIVGDGETLEVEGERYGVLNCFCYLGDMLDGGGGADVAVAARIRSGWSKFQELSPFLTSRAPSPKLKGRVFNSCVRSAMLYGSETWPMSTENERRLKTADTRMVRMMSGQKLREKHPGRVLMEMTGLEDITDVARRRRLRWYGHVERKDGDEWTKMIWKDWDAEGRRPPGRPRLTWETTVKRDCTKLRLKPGDAHDRTAWKKAIGARHTQ